MHSRLAALMGSITSTSLRPPPSFFMKQFDRPCVLLVLVARVVLAAVETAAAMSFGVFPAHLGEQAPGAMAQVLTKCTWKLLARTTTQYTSPSRLSPALTTMLCRNCFDMVCWLRRGAESLP